MNWDGWQLTPKSRSSFLMNKYFGEQKALHIFNHSGLILPWKVKGYGAQWVQAQVGMPAGLKLPW